MNYKLLVLIAVLASGSACRETGEKEASINVAPPSAPEASENAPRDIYDPLPAGLTPVSARLVNYRTDLPVGINPEDFSPLAVILPGLKRLKREGGSPPPSIKWGLEIAWKANRREDVFRFYVLESGKVIDVDGPPESVAKLQAWVDSIL